MAEIIRMPKMSDTMEEGVIATWLKKVGEKYETECQVTWCKNRITVFDFSLGHNVPVSKGGSDRISNLHPICCRCNTCMGNKYTIKEWNKAF